MTASGNTINMISGSAGIWATGTGYGGSYGFYNNIIHINSNNQDQTLHAIELGSLYNLYLHGNQVITNSGVTGNPKGAIGITNSTFNDIAGNQVTNNGLYSPAPALDIIQSTINNICSNHLYNTGVGLNINGGSYSYIKSNNFAYHTTAVQLNTNLGSVQDHNANSWGTNTNAAVDNTYNSTNKFLVQYLPSGNINPAGLITPDGRSESNGCSYTPGAVASPQGSLATRGVQPIDYDMSVLEGAVSADPESLCRRWMEQKGVFIQAEKDGVFAAIPAVSKFVSQSSVATIGKQYQVSKNIGALFQPSSTDAAQLKSLETEMNIQANQIWALELQIKKASSKSDSVNLRANQLKLKGTLQITTDSWNKVKGNLKTQRLANVGGVVQANEAISASMVFEKNEQAINRVYLNTIAQDVDTFTNAQKNVIDPIAAQCPFIGGSAVYVARALQSSYKKVKYNDAASCGTTIKRKETASISTVETGNKIYPNPTTGTLTLELGVPLQTDGKLIICDVTGKEAAGFVLPAGTSVYTPDISKLSPGIYMCKLWDGSKMVWSEKLFTLKQ